MRGEDLTSMPGASNHQTTISRLVKVQGQSLLGKIQLWTNGKISLGGSSESGIKFRSE